ncbi:MAG: alpha/beta hydrolase [Dehalococcoidales bacterium]|nr:MAG: alpha/beta hydrolase [Dehalococcoidales bacterium]
MKKKTILMGVIIMLFSVMLPGCGDSEPTEIKVVSEEISWPIGETTVYATITRPKSGENLPGVVFIPGSGPTDRDWNSPLLPGKNGSAALLAEELARNGYVTIRYDKRFAGIYAAENLPLLTGKISMESHLEELRGAVKVLTERPEIDDARIFTLANSEGCIHAINYQLEEENGFAGLILAAPPGQSVGDLARTQIEAQLAGTPGTDEIMKLYDEAVDGFLATGTMEPDDSLPDGIKTFLQSLANPANMPFTLELWQRDIAPDLKKISVPVLVIIGKKDIQVNWEFDGGKLQIAAEGLGNISFVFPDSANHVLKYEELPREEINLTNPNYNGSDRVLDTETLDIIIEWLDTNL